MAVVAAFGTLANTTNAGLTAYFRAAGCTAITIADVLPLLSKITVYEQEYVIGEMKIWDTGSESAEPNNCAMARVMVYNDGWVVAWFDKEATNQGSTGGCGFVDAQTIENFGTFIKYQDQFNGCLLEVESSSPADSECPNGTIFCIREANFTDQTMKVHTDMSSNAYHFNTGHTYTVGIYQTNGNALWMGHTSASTGNPTNLANRLYRAIYEMWENLRYSSNSTDSTDTAATKAFLDDGGSFTDDTTDFNDDGANDCPLMPATEEVDDAFYFGSANKFRGLNLNIGQAGVGNTIVWEYWDGSAWSSLTVTDATNGFTVAGANTVTFTPYDDWAKTTVNSSEQYWIRSRVSVASFTTQPLLTQGWVIVPDALAYTDANLGMYSFEDVSANYCLICGISKGLSGNASAYYYFYNTALLGKTIYSHSISYGTDTHYYASYVASRTHLEFNGSNRVLFENGEDSNGFEIKNIESLDSAVGSQNVFQAYIYSTYGATTVINMGAVLITS